MELSITFSDEELASLAGILSESVPRIGLSTLDGLSTARRAERLSAAEASLRSRGIVVTTPTGATEVAVPVARLVEILSRPVMTVSARFRSCDWIVVKPLTSSPAMPMTHCVGRKPAISSASWSATEQLSTTALMSVTVPDCIWARPWRLRPTPRTVPMPASSISKTTRPIIPS